MLNVTTLGMPRMNQLLDTITPVDHKRYMHHYNFPPFSTGETGFMRGPKRREIGHGLLAERALLPVVPERGGVPLHAAPGLRRAGLQRLDVDGVGLRLDPVADGRRRAPQGAGGRHRHGPRLRRGQLRDPDRHPRVPRTPSATWTSRWPARPTPSPRCSSTPRSPACPADVLAKALLQAKEARLAILDVMAGAIAEPRDHVADSAPKIVSMEIPIDKIGEVIGPKGKVINTLQQETGADIAVDDDGMVGTVTIGAKDGNAVEEARRRISLILDPPTAEVGAVYPARWSTSPSSAPSSTCCPAATACCTSPSCRAGRWQADQQRRGRARRWASRSRCGSTTSTPRARCRCRWLRCPRGRRPAAVGDVRADGGGDGDRDAVATAVRDRAAPATAAASASTGRRSAPSRPTGRLLRGRLRGRAGGRLRRPRPGRRPTGGARGDRGGDRGGDRRPPREPPASSLIETVRPAVRHPPGHRDHGGCPLGGGGLLGGHRARATSPTSWPGPRTSSSTCSSRAPTPARPSAIAEALDEVGGDCNAFTTKEYTTFYVRLLAEHLPLGLDILSDIMWQPGPAARRRRRRAHGDPRRDPDARRRAGRPGRRAVAAALFPDHALGRDTLGHRQRSVAT